MVKIFNKTVCEQLPFAKVTMTEWFMNFYGICNFCFICYAVEPLQYSKSAWSKVGTATVYIALNSWLITPNWRKAFTDS